MDIFVYGSATGQEQRFEAQAHRQDTLTHHSSLSLGDLAKEMRAHAWNSRYRYPSESIRLHFSPPADLEWLPSGPRPEPCGIKLSANNQEIFRQIFVRTADEAERMRNAFETAS